MKMMMIFAILAMMLGCAFAGTFLEKSLTTAQTSYNLSNIPGGTPLQTGNGTYFTLLSNNTTEAATVYVRYFSNTTLQPVVVSLTFNGSQTGGIVNSTQNRLYRVVNSTQKNNSYDFEFSNRTYFTLKSKTAGCFNFTNVTHVVVAATANVSNNLTSSKVTDMSDTSSGRTLYLYNITTAGPSVNFNITGNVTEVWFSNAAGTVTKIKNTDTVWRLNNCTNANVTSNTTQTVDMNVTDAENATNGWTNNTQSYYNYNDALYLLGFYTTSAVTNGNISLWSSDGTRLFGNITTGSTTPVDNGGSMMCLKSTGCTVTSLFYSNDATVKYRALVRNTTYANRTALSFYNPVGSSQMGVGLIKFKQFEWLEWELTGYTALANASIYYEVN